MTFAWQEWNSSYTVRLAVKDSGFGSNKPNTGYLNRSVQVQIDVTLHADLKVEAGTLKLNPADPEESAQMTVTVNVTNKAGRAAAGNVTTQVLAISGGVTTVVATQADWFDKNGNPKGSKSIASPETVTLVFHLSLSGQGNKTLQVYVYDSSEPYTWITSENRASLPVNVRQPAWQPYAIYGSVIGIIALFVFGMYARLVRCLQPEALERVAEDDPGAVDEGDPRIPQADGVRGQDGAIPIELVELRREVRGERGDGVDAATIRRISNHRRELRDPTQEPLLLGMGEAFELAGALSLGFREDAARPSVRILQERRRISLEVEGLLPAEQDRLFRLDTNDIVADRADSDRLCDHPFPLLREVLAPLRHLGVGAVERLLEQVVQVDDATLPRRHAALRQGHERVEDRLWRPIDAHQFERRLEPLKRELVILPEDIDRDVAALLLVQVVRDVPRRVQRGAVLAHEDVLGRVALEPESAEVDVARAVLLVAQGHQGPPRRPSGCPSSAGRLRLRSAG